MPRLRGEAGGRAHAEEDAVTAPDGLNVTEAAAYVRLHRSTVSRLVAA